MSCVIFCPTGNQQLLTTPKMLPKAKRNPSLSNFAGSLWNMTLVAWLLLSGRQIPAAVTDLICSPLCHFGCWKKTKKAPVGDWRESTEVKTTENKAFLRYLQDKPWRRRKRSLISDLRHNPRLPSTHTQHHVHIQQMSVGHIMPAEFICTAVSESTEVAPQQQMYKLQR